MKKINTGLGQHVSELLLQSLLAADINNFNQYFILIIYIHFLFEIICYRNETAFAHCNNSAYIFMYGIFRACVLGAGVQHGCIFKL